jgi:hypothetical protein
VTTEDMIWTTIGYAVIVLTLWWAYKDQSVGIDGGFEFPRETRAIRFWLVTSVAALMAVAIPVLLIADWLGY